MKWMEITVVTSQEAKEAVADILYRAGATGVVVEDAALPILADDLEDYSPIAIPDIPLEEVRVTAYLPLLESVAAVIESIRLEVVALTDFGLDPGRGEVLLAEVEEEDWATAWKQYYKPVRIGQRVIVKPSWENVDAPEGVVVVELDPGMAFGTGTHPTTMMCLEYLELTELRDKRVLDMGCGSGILSIAAAKLGAREVVALDYDPVAVDVAKKNVEHNRVNDKVFVGESNLFSKASGTFDIIVANIIARVIIEAIPDVHKYLNPGGLFLASGIIREKQDAVEDALLRYGFEVSACKTEGEWVALTATYKGH